MANQEDHRKTHDYHNSLNKAYKLQPRRTVFVIFTNQLALTNLLTESRAKTWSIIVRNHQSFKCSKRTRMTVNFLTQTGGNAMNHPTRQTRLLLTLVASAFLLSAAVSTNADPVLTFNPATGLNGVNQNQSVGWQFNVVTSLTVTGLGWYDEGANGLTTAHMVGIWSPGGALLASVLVPAGAVASLDGQFRTIAIAPIVLAVGNGYIVGGENFAQNTERLAFNVTQTVDPRIAFVDATFSDVGSGFVRPTNFSVAETGFYGPSFSVAGTQNVPEPATLLLLGSGLAGVLTQVRKRRKG